MPDNGGTTAAELVDEAPAPVEAKAVETTAKVEAPSVSGDSHEAAASKPAHTSAQLFEQLTGSAVDSPLCMTCGTKMRTAGSCHVCEGCGSTCTCTCGCS